MKDYGVYLEDMLAFAEEAGSVARMSGNDRLRQLSLERLLVMLAEAAKQIPRSLQPNYPQIPWVDIIELRNTISHGYDRHSLAELQQFATHEAQELVGVLKSIFEQQKD